MILFIYFFFEYFTKNIKEGDRKKIVQYLGGCDEDFGVFSPFWAVSFEDLLTRRQTEGTIEDRLSGAVDYIHSLVAFSLLFLCYLYILLS